LQNLKWLPSQKDGFAVSDSRGEELARTEVNLKFSESYPARARILHGTLRTWAAARPIRIISE
jgi:hypothetical protein